MPSRPTGNALFSLPNAFTETMLLLFGSITFSLATLAMKSSKERMLSWLAVTFLLGLGFVSLEIREFHGMVRAGAAGAAAERCRPFHAGRHPRPARDLRPDLDASS